MFGGLTTFQIARQTSGRVAVTDMTSFHPIPLISDTIETQIAELVSDGMRARFDEGAIQQGLVSAQGDVSFRWAPSIIPVFFRAFTAVISTTALGSGDQHFLVPTQTEFDNDFSVTPHTIESYRDGQLAHQYLDACMNRLTVEFRGGQLLGGTATFMARTSSGKAATAPTYRTETDFTGNQASVSLGGVGWPHFEVLTLTFDNALEYVATLDGSDSPRRIKRGGLRTVRIGGTIDIPVTSAGGMWADFRAGTERQLIVTAEGGTSISSGVFNRMKIDVPTFRYSTWPVGVTGPGRVTVGFAGRAVYNAGSGMLCLLSAQNSWALY